MMNLKRAVLAGCLLALAFTSKPALAQGLPSIFTGTLATVTSPSPFPADWQNSGTLATMTVYNNNGPVTCLIQTVVAGSQGTAATIPSSTVIPGGVTALATPFLANWASIGITGKAKESVEKTGHLPDGTYTIIVRVTNAHDSFGTALNDITVTSVLVVSVPQPPALLYPPNDAVVVVPHPVFQWTPSIRASGTQPAYQFRLVEMLPGQTSLQSIEANYPLVEGVIQNTTALPYPASVPQLVEGRRYAWRVQAVEASAAFVKVGQGVLIPVGANDGKSPVFTFNFRPAVRASGDAGGLQGSQDSGEGTSPEPGHGERPPEPGSEGRMNFADRLIHALVARWNHNGTRPSYTNHSDALPITRNEWNRALSQIVLAAAYDSSGSVFGPFPLDTSPPAVTPDTLITPEPLTPPLPDVATQQPGSGFGPEWLKLHGGASLAGETYSRGGVGSPTRPFHSARLTTGLSFGLMNDRLRMPLNALISGDQVAFRQNINQVALTPRFSWAGLQAGNFAPQFSTYTLADATLLGGGFELTPNQWRIAFADGRSRKAIAADPAEFVQPQFARNVLAGRIGRGDPLANSVEFSVMRAKDDENSLDDPDTTIVTTPESNMVYGLKLQHVLPKGHLRAQVEGALSFYDRDHRADAPSVKGQAIAVRLFRETVLSSVGATFEVLNGGFMSLGNSGISNDRVDIGLTGRTQLMNGKLSLNGNAGWRNDNVSKTLLAETAKRNYSFNASWQPRTNFGTDVQFGFMSTDASEADSVAGSGNITRLVAINPHVNWATRGIQQTLAGSATIQSSDNTTTAPIPLTSTKGLTLLANWSAALTQALSINFGGNYTKSDYETAVSEISTFGPGFSWNLPRHRVATSAQLQFTRSRTGNFGTDTEFAPRCEIGWQTTPNHALILRGNFRRYRYAVGSSTEFNERLASLEYRASL